LQPPRRDAVLPQIIPFFLFSPVCRPLPLFFQGFELNLVGFAYPTLPPAHGLAFSFDNPFPPDPNTGREAPFPPPFSFYMTICVQLRSPVPLFDPDSPTLVYPPPLLPMGNMPFTHRSRGEDSPPTMTQRPIPLHPSGLPFRLERIRSFSLSLPFPAAPLIGVPPQERSDTKPRPTCSPRPTFLSPTTTVHVSPGSIPHAFFSCPSIAPLRFSRSPTLLALTKSTMPNPFPPLPA